MIDLELPPCQLVDARACISRQGSYVTFAVAERSTGKVLTAFTLHRVEAHKLCERLAGLLASTEDGGLFVEGACLGGPPSGEQGV
jgi:hypothetical protein